MPEIPKFDFLSILRVLAEHRVDFILVGGVAASVLGALNMTWDLDALYSTDESNIERLLGDIDALDGYYRMHGERRLRPNASHLAAGGHDLLSTHWGPLDLLGTVGAARNYRSLLPNTIEVDVGEGLAVQVLDLETQIAVKEETGRDKDLAVLPILRRTLEESRRR